MIDQRYTWKHSVFCQKRMSIICRFCRMIGHRLITIKCSEYHNLTFWEYYYYGMIRERFFTQPLVVNRDCQSSVNHFVLWLMVILQYCLIPISVECCSAYHNKASCIPTNRFFNSWISHKCRWNLLPLIQQVIPFQIHISLLLTHTHIDPFRARFLLWASGPSLPPFLLMTNAGRRSVVEPSISISSKNGDSNHINQHF